MKIEILGVKIDVDPKEEILKKIKGFLQSSGQYYIATPNPEMLVLAQEDEEFKAVLNKADLAVPDGFGLVLASRVLGKPIKERITGIDLIFDICALAEQKKCSVYLLGAKQGVAERAGETLKKKFSDLEIRGATEGLPAAEFDDEQKNREVIEMINFAKPDILFVAFGHGKQEKWIGQNLKKMSSIKVAMGVGGAFDFIAGAVPRAPKTLRRLGLEWLWRLLLQPWRVSRIWNATIKFSFKVIKEKIKG